MMIWGCGCAGSCEKIANYSKESKLSVHTDFKRLYLPQFGLLAKGRATVRKPGFRAFRQYARCAQQPRTVLSAFLQAQPLVSAGQGLNSASKMTGSGAVSRRNTAQEVSPESPLNILSVIWGDHLPLAVATCLYEGLNANGIGQLGCPP